MGSVLILDGYNMIHRCRFSWRGGAEDIGDTTIVYNFFRVLRSTIEQFPSDRVYFVTEGGLSHRLAISKDYKANRVRVASDLSQEEVDYWDSFSSQKRLIIDSLKEFFPVSVVRHPNYEADDVIFNLAKNYHENDDILIVSSDTDFIQAINLEPDRIKLWNPISKSYRESTDYDYVAWKAMVGDKSDNISGVPRIGKKTAEKILRTPGELGRRMASKSFSSPFSRSEALIRFIDFNDLSSESYGVVEFSNPKKSWDSVRLIFNNLGFKFSSFEDKWDDYCDTFDHLWYNYSDIGDI